MASAGKRPAVGVFHAPAGPLGARMLNGKIGLVPGQVAGHAHLLAAMAGRAASRDATMKLAEDAMTSGTLVIRLRRPSPS